MNFPDDAPPRIRQFLSSWQEPGAEDAPAPPGQGAMRLGKYRLVSQVGRGGMGTVYEAEDTELQRRVALKVLREEDANPAVVARLHREGKILAQLQHPNIVPVYEVGIVDRPVGPSIHFIAMPFIDGRTLAEVLRERPPDRTETLRMLEEVARAAAYAHAQGVIHRDLKPSNVLVDPKGKVFLTDFGLARAQARRTDLTKSESVMGTPLYMAPEQVQGRVDELDARTDVYALGVMLYEILAGRPPFVGETPTELYDQILNQDPTRPGLHGGAVVAADLEIICLKAMEKEPARRYASAAEFADDLGRCRRGEAIHARPPSVLYRLRKRLAKRKVPLAVAAGGVALVATLLMVFLPAMSAEREARDRTLHLWERVSMMLSDGQRYAHAGEMESARRELDRGAAECRAFLQERELPQVRYFLGRLLRASGRLSEARAELDRALASAPDLREARLERGLVGAEDYARAWAEIGALEEEIHPHGAAELERRHPLLKELRDRAMADLSVEIPDAVDSAESDRRFARAELARLRMDDPDDVRSRLEEVTRRDPLHADAMLSLARLELSAGRLDESIRWATEAMGRHRGLADACLARSGAWIWKAAGDRRAPESAEWTRRGAEDADRAIALDPERTFAFHWRSHIRLQTGDVDGAIADCDEVLRRDPRYAGAHLNRGTARVAKGLLDGAIADYDDALRLNPDLVQALNFRAVVRGRQRRFAEAIQDETEAIARRPDFAPAFANRALYRLETGESAGALADADEAVRLLPLDAETHRIRARILAILGRPEEVLTVLDRAIELDPRNPVLYFDRGRARGRGKDFAGAISDYDQAIQLDPGHEKAHLHRAISWETMAEWARAAEGYEDLLRRMPADWPDRPETQRRLEAVRARLSPPRDH